MSETAKTPELTQSEVALEVGSKVIAAAVELAAATIDETTDPEVRESLENVLRDKLIESGLPLIPPSPEELDPSSIYLRRGRSTNRSRDQVIMDSRIAFGIKVASGGKRRLIRPNI